MADYIVFYNLLGFRVENVSRYVRHGEREVRTRCGSIVRVDLQDKVNTVIALAYGCINVGGIAQKLCKLYVGGYVIASLLLADFNRIGSEREHDFLAL